MKQLHRFVRIVLATIVALTGFGFTSEFTSEVHADVPYPHYFMSPAGDYFPVPAPYEPDGTIRLEGQLEGGLSKPKDLFIDRDDRIYVADTGNNRIVAMDRSGNHLQIYGGGAEGDEEGEQPLTEAESLKEPSGVFVNQEGIYVADTGNKRIVLFNRSGEVLRTIGQPASTLLGEDFTYAPLKVVVDSRGYLYVVNQGTQRGLLMMDTKGQFRGYFGANRTQAGLSQTLIRLLYSKEIRRGTAVILPYSFNNVVLSPDGFLYTTTTGQASKQIRKLNAVGGDIFPNAARNFSEPSPFQADKGGQIFTDAAVDQSGNVTLLDSTYGRMYQYDATGRLLFSFGATGLGKGLTGSPQSIAVDSQGILYVLDAARGEIQRFRPTPFAQLVHQANELYAQGRYNESFEPWREVVRLDAYYTLALQAMGQTQLRQENYAGAMDSFRAADDKGGYSAAFYEQRRLFIRDHFGWIASVVLAAIAAIMVIRSIWVRRKRKLSKTRKKSSEFLLIEQIKGVLKHPTSSFEALRYEGKGRWRDALLLVGLFVIVNLLGYLLPSFHFQTTPLRLVRWEFVAMQTIGVWLLWCLVQYGLTTVLSGEGRLRDVMIGTAYCFAPLILFTVPLRIATHALTFQEKPIYDLFMTALYAWVIVLLFIKIRETHDYSNRKALGVGMATVAGCFVVIGFAIVLYGMSLNLLDFVNQIVKEATAVD
ncbi:YIP1 family protein [Paenibacillus eucommiae]|uniref:Sugar lactone lactonase YvrE n=1 Tax=Paenibacillus eucommiae TaxID=1355755 RepID=A0ABS4IVX6_9BACL|nr:YIP1 family protein [Paenibacillus eucommiae]MBP1991747.1 sugar lactone lactonase YvrE [Paenibacillus eucommiae]